MAFIRPSLILQAMLVPEEYNDATAREIKRSYMHIAQSIVKELPAEEENEGNIMQFRIRMMKPYWDLSDPAAEELWSNVMPQWLQNQTRNVSTAMHNFNTVNHPRGAKNVSYEWADFEFNNHALIRVKTDGENRVPVDMVKVAGDVRRLLNAGAFGEGEITRVRVPSLASIAEQKAAYEALKEEVRLEQEKLDEDALLRETAAMEVTPDELADAIEGAPFVAEGAASEDITAAEEAAPEVAEPAVTQVPTLPPFELSYRVWGIEFADGTVKEYESTLA